MSQDTGNRAQSAFAWLHWRSWRFMQLLIFMLLVLLLEPLYAEHLVLAVAADILILNGMMVSLTAAGFVPRLRWLFFSVWLISILFGYLAGWDGPVTQSPALYVAGRVAAMAVLLGCVVAALRYVLRSQQVTLDSICAAMVAYLFIGLTFAVAYQCIFTLDAHSFSIPSDMSMSRQGDIEVSMIYYSYVTLATLGYGDIAPRLPFAQMIASLEAIVGQFYIAVIIAWLVSVYAAERRTAVHAGRKDDA